MGYSFWKAFQRVQTIVNARHLWGLQGSLSSLLEQDIAHAKYNASLPTLPERPNMACACGRGRGGAGLYTPHHVLFHILILILY